MGAGFPFVDSQPSFPDDSIRVEDTLKGPLQDRSDDRRTHATEILGENAVYVWLLPVGADADRGASLALQSILSIDERERCGRYRRAGDRHLFALGRGLLRTLLSRFAPPAPAEWVFRANRYGRPEIEGPCGYGWLRFNLSHTEGLVAVALARGRDVGVDVEPLGAVAFDQELPRGSLSPSELAALARQPRADRERTFLQLWTLKEAYLKAIGRGHSAPARSISFDVPLDDPARVSFGPELGDTSDRWHFRQISPSPSHVLALAVRRSDADLDLSVSTRSISDLFGVPRE